MSVVEGELYTVSPHVLPHGAKCGTWHCRITSVGADGKATAQQMKIVDGRWRPSMSTCVFVSALRPLAVQLDLFGDPVGEPA
jgi:hypothetical protein